MHMSFSVHLTTQKNNGFVTANRKPFKDQLLFLACDHLIKTYDMLVFWKKVWGHSRVPGTDKTLNDLANAMAKIVAVSCA